MFCTEGVPSPLLPTPSGPNALIHIRGWSLKPSERYILRMTLLSPLRGSKVAERINRYRMTSASDRFSAPPIRIDLECAMASVTTKAGVCRGEVTGDLGHTKGDRGPIEAERCGPMSRKLSAGDLASTGAPRCVCTAVGTAALADCTGRLGCVCTALGEGIWSFAIEARLDLLGGVAGPAAFTRTDAGPLAWGVPASVLPVVVDMDMLGEAIFPSDRLACKGKQMAPLGKAVAEAAGEPSIWHGSAVNVMGALARRSGECVGDVIRRVWIMGDHEATCTDPGDDRMAAWHHGSQNPHYLEATTSACNPFDVGIITSLHSAGQYFMSSTLYPLPTGPHCPKEKIQNTQCAPVAKSLASFAFLSFLCS